MIEMAKAMTTAAEHGVMPETMPETDDVNAELKDGLKDSRVLGGMNPKAVTKDETYDDARNTESSVILVTEPEVMVMTKDGTLGFVRSEMNFVKQCSVEESISDGCTSGHGEPGMNVCFTKEATICVSVQV
jgi:hypothetical protein